MNARGSTVRISTEQTVGNRESLTPATTNADILSYWRSRPAPDTRAAVEKFPDLLRQKSLLLDLALEEFNWYRDADPALPLSAFCERYRGLGNSLEQSIFRLFEVKQYLDAHPDLLELVDSFEWPEPGDNWQEFRILEELGRGALARVYLCSQVGLGDREIVLKITRAGEYEASLLGRLDHRNIVPVYSVANDSVRLVSSICMPFRGRSTLQDVVDLIQPSTRRRDAQLIAFAAQRWSTAEEITANCSERSGIRRTNGTYENAVVAILGQIAGALTYAHSRNILHGDIKPSNVLLTPLGMPLLIDFNLAKDGGSTIGSRGGTLPYMAPEHLAGVCLGSENTAGGIYDVRSEIFSLGVVMYQLLTGTIPFRGKSASTDPAIVARELIEQQQTGPPLLTSANPNINSALADLVHDCLARDPADRPQTMHEVHGRLLRQSQARARLRRSLLARPGMTRWVSIAFVLISLVTVGYFGLRPSYAIREFNQGISFQVQQQYRPALACFENAIASDPSLIAAKLQHARTKMLLGEWDGAVTEFYRLEQEHKDPKAMAYGGYCFNLMGEPGAAVEWYERALRNGLETAALQNNLGVSYQLARSRLTPAERLVQAERNFSRALTLDQDCQVARRNLIELAVTRCSQDVAFNPISILPEAETLLKAMPKDGSAWLTVATLYAARARYDQQYVKKAISALETAYRLGQGPPLSELAQNVQFDAIRAEREFETIELLAGSLTQIQTRRSLIRFVDPLSGMSDAAARR